LAHVYAILKKKKFSVFLPLSLTVQSVSRPDGAHAPQHIVRSSSRFIDCHRRVSIINHLHCNRTAPRSDTEAPGRFSTSTYNSRTAKSFQSTATMEMCRTPKCCHLSSIRQTLFARRNSPARDRRDYGGGLARCGATRYIALHTRCIIRTLRTNREMPD